MVKDMLLSQQTLTNQTGLKLLAAHHQQGLQSRRGWGVERQNEPINNDVISFHFVEGFPDGYLESQPSAINHYVTGLVIT